MSAMSNQVETNVVEAKLQTASRRASSLHKDRVEYKKQCEASSKNRSKSAGPRGSDFSAPHCDAGEVDVHIYYATNISPDALSSESTAALSPQSENSVPSPSFDLSLDDRSAFPVLPSPSPKQAKEAKEAVITPEKSTQRCRHQVAEDKENEDDMPKDWVVLTSEDAEKADLSRPVSQTGFDSQHPRNLFANKGATKHATLKADSQELPGMDWSSAGMPTALIKRLIHGSSNTAHRGPHNAQASPLAPMSVLRAQNLGSSKRERSTPKSPRSNSNSRVMKHSGSRR